MPPALPPPVHHQPKLGAKLRSGVKGNAASVLKKIGNFILDSAKGTVGAMLGVLHQNSKK